MTIPDAITSALWSAAAVIISAAAAAAVAYLRAFTARQNALAVIQTDAAQAARLNTAVVASAQQKAADPTLDSATLVAQLLPGSRAAQAKLGVSDATVAARIDGAAIGLVATK